MATNQTVRAYPGATPADSQAMFQADAAQAAAGGWYPVAQAWDGATLIVTYGPAPGALPVTRKRPRTPWLWIVGILGVIVLLAAVARPSTDQAGTSGRPAATPTPTPPTMVAEAPTVTTRTTVGDTIVISLTVKNMGKVPHEIVVGIKDLSQHALFVGCVPECEDLGESFTGQKLRLPGPLPGRSSKYTITWQATDAARADWSMWMSADDDGFDADDPAWEATTVILL